MNCMIENECVRAQNYAVFRPSVHELKYNSRTSLAINIHVAFLYQEIVIFFVLCSF